MRGAFGSGASGSSTISAKLFVPAGAPGPASGGEISRPSQVYGGGISPLCANALEVSISGMGWISARRTPRASPNHSPHLHHRGARLREHRVFWCLTTGVAAANALNDKRLFSGTGVAMWPADKLAQRPCFSDATQKIPSG